MKSYFFLFLFITLYVTALSQTDNKSNKFNIVPEPVSISVLKSSPVTINSNSCLFFLNAGESISNADKIVKYIIDDFKSIFLTENLYFKKLKNKEEKEITFSNSSVIFEISKKENAKLGKEGYNIQIEYGNILVVANTTSGFLNAYQTLKQMIPVKILPQTLYDYSAIKSGLTASIKKSDKEVSVTFPAVSILDYPRFEWRGSHIDVCRHFFDINYILKHIDLMAHYKLNKFHWHLTDDHGWRIEVESYPKLLSVGAWRVDRSSVRWLDGKYPHSGEPATYGGYYTKEQIKFVVDYAAARNIDVIPEIEIPGHCSAILASYPQLACDDYPYIVEIGPYWPPKAILCGGNDSVMIFFKNIFDEIVTLFPYKYVHIGGDEALKDNWKVCQKCQKRIVELNLASEEALQGFMIREIEKYLQTKNREIIGWDEILDGGVSSNATVMSWRGEKGGIEAAKQGNKVIMTPNSHCYLDYYQFKEEFEPEAICCYIPLEKAYSFNPIPLSLTEKEASFVLGGQANLWAEFLSSTEKAQYMLLPRLLAISESCWTLLEKKNWDLFLQKLPAQKEWMLKNGYNFCDKIGLTNKDE